MISLVRRSLLLMGIGATLLTAVGIGLGVSTARVERSGAATGASGFGARALAGTAEQLLPGAPARGDFVSRLTPFSATLARRASAGAIVPVGRAAAVTILPRPPDPIPLDAGWQYQADPGNVGVAQSWGQGGAPQTGWTAVTLPNGFNPTVSSAGFAGQVGWYETTFTGPSVSGGRGWQLAFESVRRNATVYLNGLELGTHHDPYAPFTLPATSLVPHATNTLIVRVDNFRGASAFPEDWWNWGGITGPVSLVPVGRIALHDLGVMPELSCRYRCGDLRVEGTLTNDIPVPLTPSLTVRVTSPSGAVGTVTRSLGSLEGSASRSISLAVPIRRPRLWSPSHPALYKVQVETAVGSRVESSQTLQVGMRSVRVYGGILYLNGHRLWLHGASIHEDIEGHGAALTDADVAEIVGELKAVGANITRSHYPLSPRLLDALDRAGIMVWAQPPVDHADPGLARAAGRRQALAMLRSTLLQDRSHASVIVDSVGNELSPTLDTTPGTRAYVNQAIAMARALNPQVPVALDIYCYTNFPAQQTYRRLEVIGISDYFGWGTGPTGHGIASLAQLAPYLKLQHRRYPAQALVVSEYGAEAFYDGAATTKGTYEFQSDYLRQTGSVLDRLPFVNGSIYWTLREFAVNPGWIGGATMPPGYTPDGIHHKGLIAYSGALKPAFSVAQQLFAATPAFVPHTPAVYRTDRQAQAAFCRSRWCADGPGGHLLP
jgi:beta-glucuronidase